MLPNILTTEDTVRIKNKLSALNRSIFDIGNDVDKTLDSIFSHEEKAGFKDFFSEQNLKITSTENIKLGIAKLLEEIENTPTAVLTLAYVPSTHSVRRISSFIAERTNQPTILRNNTNPKILGGALIEYQGKFADYSLSAAKK